MDTCVIFCLTYFNPYILFIGWVVKKAIKEVSCETCREYLVARVPSERFAEAFTLLNLKDLGRLQRPSDPVIVIMLAAERHLRQMSDINHLNRHCTLLRLEVKVFQTVGSDAIGTTEHALETAVGVDNHCLSLVRFLVRRYFTVRVHHIARLHTSLIQKQKQRQKYTKLVLFKGQ